jgi:Chaperone of endosialidase
MNEGSNMKSTLLAAVLCTATVCSVSALAQTDTTFTYQGELMESGSLADGAYSMDFLLYDSLIGGSQIGLTITIAAQSVSDGLFNAELDFGVQDFAGSQHWLEIIVDGNTLSPRQPVTASPFSIQTRGIFIGDDGNVTFDSMAAVEGIFKMTSIGGIDMIIEADTNNAGEDQNARIVMSQDGGAVVARMGYREGTNELEIMQEYPNNLILGTNNVDHVTIGENGNVGIGTNITQAPLHVVGDGLWTIFSKTTGGFAIWGETSQSGGTGVYGVTTAIDSGGIGVHGRSDGTNGRGIRGFASAGSGVNYGVQGNSNSFSGYDFYAAGFGINYGAASSIRWKSNVVNISNPLDKLAQLRGVYYDWDEEHGGQRAIGMIAEEVGNVLPEIVGYEENGVDAIGMDYSMLTPLLVESTNALRAEKDAQLAQRDEQIEQLNQRITQLEQMITQISIELSRSSK